MNNQPLISIIVPVYNVEKYLAACVESIMSQTYENLEIILVDDGSPDKCPEICDKYAKQDSRIKVIHKPNGGLSDARNAGLLIAEGEYIGFVDGDDYISSNMYSRLKEAMDRSEADIAVCNYAYADEKGNVTDVKVSFPLDEKKLSGREIMENKVYNNMSWLWSVVWNRLYKREIFNDIKFRVGKLHEDEFIMHEIFLQDVDIIGVDEPLYYYVIRANSIMGRGYSIRKYDRVEAYFERAEALCINNCSANTAYATVKMAIGEMQKGFECLDIRKVEVKSRYKELQLQYRRLLKPMLRLKISVKQKVFLLLNAVSIYGFWQIKTVVK